MIKLNEFIFDIESHQNLLHTVSESIISSSIKIFERSSMPVPLKPTKSSVFCLKMKVYGQYNWTHILFKWKYMGRIWEEAADPMVLHSKCLHGLSTQTVPLERKGQHGILCPQHSEIKCCSNCTYSGFNLEEQSIGSMVFNFGCSKENFEAYICSNFMESTHESHCISGEGFYLVNTWKRELENFFPLLFIQ